jgi:hypothetical protein
MPYVTTLSGLNSSLISAAPRSRKVNMTMPRFMQKRAAIPAAPADGTLVAQAASATARFALALVPFGALAWVFIAY